MLELSKYMLRKMLGVELFSQMQKEIAEECEKATAEIRDRHIKLALSCLLEASATPENFPAPSKATSNSATELQKLLDKSKQGQTVNTPKQQTMDTKSGNQDQYDSYLINIVGMDEDAVAGMLYEDKQAAYRKNLGTT